MFHMVAGSPIGGGGICSPYSIAMNNPTVGLSEKEGGKKKQQSLLDLNPWPVDLKLPALPTAPHGQPPRVSTNFAY